VWRMCLSVYVGGARYVKVVRMSVCGGWSVCAEGVYVYTVVCVYVRCY
jgi:hypothetical protein